MLIALDAGHGIDTVGKGVPGLKEHDFNSAVVKYAKEHLENNGFSVLLTQPLNGKDTPLKNRTDLANSKGAKLFLSFHADANSNTSARGHWAFYWHTSAEGKKFADIWSKELSRLTGTKHRGNRPSIPGTWTNFHVVRETRMLAVLMEHGFMTNPEDLKLLKSDTFRRQCGEAAARAVCIYFNQKFIEEKPTLGNIDFSKFNPDKGIGICQVIKDIELRTEPKVTKTNYIRVLKVGEIYYVYGEENGFYNVGASYVDKRYVKFYPHNKPSQPSKPQGNSIIGKSKATLEQMVQFVKRNNPNFNPLIAQEFLNIGNKYNIRGDVAFCQSIIETDWFRFGNGTAVTPNQHNYCGLGVTSKGVKGHSFPTIKDGVTAQIQHLFAYATEDNLPAGEVLIDPRFKYVSRGIAPNWEDLSGRWAADKEYGKKIINMYNQLLNFKPQPTPQTTKNENVTYAVAEINGVNYDSVIINDKGYIRVTDVAAILGYKALFDKIQNKIVFIKE